MWIDLIEYHDSFMVFTKRKLTVIHVALDIESSAIGEVSNTKC